MYFLNITTAFLYVKKEGITSPSPSIYPNTLQTLQTLQPTSPLAEFRCAVYDHYSVGQTT